MSALRCAAHGPDQEVPPRVRLRPVFGRSGGAFGRLANALQRRFAWYPGDWICRCCWRSPAPQRRSSCRTRAPRTAPEGGTPHSADDVAWAATVALPSVPTGTPTGPPTTPTAPPPATPTPSPERAAGRESGFTVVLGSHRRASGHSLAITRARSAPGPDCLRWFDSSRYSSLHPGYYVVFSGIYSSRGQANGALRECEGFRGGLRPPDHPLTYSQQRDEGRDFVTGPLGRV